MPSLAWACFHCPFMVKLGMNFGHRKTRKVYDLDGDAHFLTFSCFRRLPLLGKDRSCQWLVEAIGLARKKHPFDLWGWVIMPEHVHLVLWPHANVRIASILTTMKQSVSRRAIRWLSENTPKFLPNLLDQQPNGKQSYRFWQRGGGYDRNLRSTRDVHEKISYVHRNPVKLLLEPPEFESDSRSHKPRRCVSTFREKAAADDTKWFAAPAIDTKSSWNQPRHVRSTWQGRSVTFCSEQQTSKPVHRWRPRIRRQSTVVFSRRLRQPEHRQSPVAILWSGSGDWRDHRLPSQPPLRISNDESFSFTR